MTDADRAFAQELDIFRAEAEASAQFLYAYLAIHATAAQSPEVVNLLNSASLFWNTTLGALQTSAFIAVGRVYDDDNRSHGLKRLLKLAEGNPQLFTLDALAIRKQGNSPTRPDWLDGYLATAYVPSPADFQELRECAQEQRAVYNDNYKKIRDKVFAHNNMKGSVNINDLFAETNMGKWQRMTLFLQSLHDALWQLYFNGVKPVLREYRYSVESMLSEPLPAGRQLPPQEKITREAAEFLTGAARKGWGGQQQKSRFSEENPSGLHRNDQPPSRRPLGVRSSVHPPNQMRRIHAEICVHVPQMAVTPT